MVKKLKRLSVVQMINDSRLTPGHSLDASLLPSNWQMVTTLERQRQPEQEVATLSLDDYVLGQVSSLVDTP